jgi:hypothetical protein
MTRAVVAACCACAVVVARPSMEALRPQEAAVAARRGVVAVLRRDGLLLPFASFKDDGFKAPWPDGLRDKSVPLNLESVPDDWWGGEVPSGWRARLTDGTEREIQVTTPQVYVSGCESRLGVRTDYTSDQPIPEVPVEPYPKDGVVISNGAILEPIEQVRPETSGGPRLLEVLTPELNDLEDGILRRIRGSSGWRHPAEAGERHDTPVRFEAWYRTAAGERGWHASYVESVRAYAPGPADEGCGLETFFSGWVFEDPADRNHLRVDLNARVTYCDRNGVLFMLPFGQMHRDGKTFWIYQLSGWDAEWYEVTQVEEQRARPVVEFYGGGSTACLRRFGR